MTQALATELETTTAELAAKSFQAFCDDIGGMFGIEVICAHEGTRHCNAGDLKSLLGKLVAVNRVKASGALGGDFSLVFDKKAIFTLAGVIMMLPEGRTVQLCRSGEAKDATDMADALSEAGNLLVGSWDKVFREEMKGHGHFLRDNVFIGEPWGDPKKNLGLADGLDMLCVTCSVAVAPYASFKCVALFPGSIFEKPQEKPQETPQEVSQEASQETAKEPEKITETAIAEAIQSPTAPQEEPVAAEVAAVASCGDIAGIGKVLARDIMCSQIIWIDEDSPVGNVFEKMESSGASYALAGNDGHVAGVISKRDLAGAISPYLNPLFSRWRRPQDDATLDIKVKWVMGKQVRMVKTSTPVNVAVTQMLQWRIGCLPVADDNGKVQGILTRTEILKMLVRNS